MAKSFFRYKTFLTERNIVFVVATNQASRWDAVVDAVPGMPYTQSSGVAYPTIKIFEFAVDTRLRK